MIMITLSYALIVWLEWQTLKRKKNSKRQRRIYFGLVSTLFLISLLSHIFKPDFQMAELILYGFGPIEKWMMGR